MHLRKLGTRIIACVCMTAVIGTSIPMSSPIKASNYDDSVNVMIDNGGYKTEVYGWNGRADWSVLNRKDTLPPEKVYLTDHYRETVGTVPTSDWASSVVFDKYSESLYAHPLAYRAASNGMQMAYPAVRDTKAGDGEPSVASLLSDETVELVVGADGFSAVDAQVDEMTDWTYEIVMANAAGNASMRSTLAKGTPYAYYTFDNLSPTISLGAGATNLAIYKDKTNILGISLTNKEDGKTHYYGVYAPAGTTWTNAGGKLTANFPQGKSYLSVAILPDNSEDAFALYEKYAFNFITDTKVEWEYHENASKVYTRYNVTTKNMETGDTGGDTIIALYPHQWRYLMDQATTKYTYNTVRGTMKTVEGSSYVTEMTFNGMLTGLPVTENQEEAGEVINQLSYLWDYRKNKDDPKWIIGGAEGSYGYFDTYWVGKNLNVLTEAIFLADQLSADETVAGWRDDMVEGVANYLQFWFNPDDLYAPDGLGGKNVDDYFYYHEDYGTLIGYPSSYQTDSEVNDHHFHYGYWIKAAAAVAMNDPEWAKNWGGMVYEMISDIANTNRDGSSYNEKSPAKYPFLRNFDIYEGHSWASGIANFEYDENGNLVDPNGGLAGGNNQESSSESVNAWAALVLWGEAVGDKRIRDLGIYLYTTEVAAVEEYYYDVHDDVFTEAYKDKDNFDIQTVTRLFGGRYDHSTWWTENSIEATTITMLPLSGSTFYMGRYPEKVKAVIDSISEDGKQWQNFLDTSPGSANRDPKTNQDVLAMFYAYYDAEEALKRWDSSDDGLVEFGESRAHTMAYITSLKQYGTQNFEITGSTPLSLVLEKDGKKTYIAENHTDQNKRVYFSDGTYVDVPANSSYEGDKTGNGENPEVDESEILGAKKKYNLEVYCEKLDGSGYDMTSSVKNVRSEKDTFTYQPSELSGFTFDSGNANNVLTVNVTEGTIETVKVYYKRNSYTISYTLNGGTVNGTNPTSYRYGETLPLTAPVQDGYEFVGWYTNEDFTGSPLSGITPTTYGNLHLYAKFLREGAVTGISLDQTNVSLEVGESVTLKATVEPANAKDKSLEWISAKDEVATVSNAGIVTAKAEGWTVITVKTNDGEFIAQCDVFVTAVPEQSGPSYERKEMGVEIDQDGRLVLYVKHTGDVVAHCQIFDTKEAADAVKGIPVGGMPGNNMTQNGDYCEYKIDNPDMNKYLAYAFNGGILEFPEVIAIKDIPTVGNAPSGPSLAGFVVNHYLQNEKGEYTLHAALNRTGLVDEEITEDPVEYAGYKLNEAKSTVSGKVAANGSLVLNFYYDLVDGIKPQLVDYTIKYYLQNKAQNDYDHQDQDETKTATVGATVRADIRGFNGFKLNESKSITSGEVTADGKLELKLYYDRETYTVTYELDGGTNNSSNKTTYAYGVGIPVLSEPKKEGYIFEGWYENEKLNGDPVSKIASDRTGDITLYAKWKKKTGDEKKANYTVKYYEQNIEQDGYTLEDSKEIEAIVGETVSAGDEERTGFTLNTDVEGSKISGVVTEDNGLELVLYYDRNRYQIEYELNGGENSSSNAATYLYGLAMKLEDPKKEGYTFLGWYTTSNYAEGSKITGFSETQNGNITIYAKWSDGETDPTGPTDPTDPTDQIDPPDPTDQIDPPDPTDQTDPGTDDVKVAEIKINGISKKIAAGKKVQLTTEIIPTEATNPSVTWSVKADKNAKYATVDANTGLVKTKSSGKNKTVTIVATANDGSGIVAEYKIKLMQKAVKKITLKAAATTVKAGKKVKITATVTPKASTSKLNNTLQWESSNTKYATVTKKGVVTTKKAGKNKTVKITARSTDGTNKKQTIKIKIK